MREQMDQTKPETGLPEKKKPLNHFFVVVYYLVRLVADKGKFGCFAYYCWAVGLITLILTFVL